MRGRLLQPGTALTVVVVVAVVGVACGGGGEVDARTSVSSRSRGTSVTEAPSPPESPRSSVTWTVDSTEPPPPRPTECGTTEIPDGTDVTVAIASGWGTCPDAMALIDIYYRDRPEPAEDPDRRLVIDGWECITDDADESGPATTCALRGQGVVVAHP